MWNDYRNFAHAERDFEIERERRYTDLPPPECEHEDKNLSSNPVVCLECDSKIILDSGTWRNLAGGDPCPKCETPLEQGWEICCPNDDCEWGR